MDGRRVIWYALIGLNVLLEVWVRIILPITTGHDGFYHWPNIDIALHLLSGINIFFLFVLAFGWRPADALLGVYAVQMGWEATEIIGDWLLTQKAHMIDRFFTDGITDTIANIVGACIAWASLSLTGHKMAGTQPRPRAARAIRNHLHLTIPLVPIGLVLLFAQGTSYDALAAGWIILAAIIAYGTMISGKHPVFSTKDS